MNIVNYHFIKGPHVYVSGPLDEIYQIEFTDLKSGKTFCEVLSSGSETVGNYPTYFVDWNVRVKSLIDGSELLNIDQNFHGHSVYVSISSFALGDTLAWVPAVEEFRKKHGCRVFCASKFSELFENSYPEITFLSHGEFVPNIVAMYEIGWFHENGEPDLDRVPVNFRTQPMQKVAFDIMGISYQETLPLINLPPVSRKKKISIAMHATLQAKYWNNPTGWQDVVNWSRSQGFEVVLVSSEVPGHMGNSAPEGTKWLKNASILRVAEEIASSSAFLGVGSGLSWLAWATKTPTVIVSGFSENYTEPSTNVRRISSPSGKCSGCFNRYQHEHNNWKWCPDHAGTSRMFECSKNIESREVIQQLQELLNNESYNL